jgi:hypothetical protein
MHQAFKSTSKNPDVRSMTPESDTSTHTWLSDSMMPLMKSVRTMSQGLNPHH